MKKKRGNNSSPLFHPTHVYSDLFYPYDLKKSCYIFLRVFGLHQKHKTRWKWIYNPKVTGLWFFFLKKVYIYIYIYIYILSLRKKQHIYTYIYIYICYKSKVFGYPQKFLFLNPKVLFLMKQVKHQNGFIYITKSKSSWATLYTN